MSHIFCCIFFFLLLLLISATTASGLASKFRWSLVNITIDTHEHGTPMPVQARITPNGTWECVVGVWDESAPKCQRLTCSVNSVRSGTSGSVQILSGCYRKIVRFVWPQIHVRHPVPSRPSIGIGLDPETEIESGDYIRVIPVRAHHRRRRRKQEKKFSCQFQGRNFVCDTF